MITRVYKLFATAVLMLGAIGTNAQTLPTIVGTGENPNSKTGNYYLQNVKTRKMIKATSAVTTAFADDATYFTTTTTNNPRSYKASNGGVYLRANASWTSTSQNMYLDSYNGGWRIYEQSQTGPTTKSAETEPIEVVSESVGSLEQVKVETETEGSKSKTEETREGSSEIKETTSGNFKTKTETLKVTETYTCKGTQVRQVKRVETRIGKAKTPQTVETVIDNIYVANESGLSYSAQSSKIVETQNYVQQKKCTRTNTGTQFHTRTNTYSRSYNITRTQTCTRNNWYSLWEYGPWSDWVYPAESGKGSFSKTSGTYSDYSDPSNWTNPAFSAWTNDGGAKIEDSSSTTTTTPSNGEMESKNIAWNFISQAQYNAVKGLPSSFISTIQTNFRTALGNNNITVNWRCDEIGTCNDGGWRLASTVNPAEGSQWMKVMISGLENREYTLTINAKKIGSTGSASISAGNVTQKMVNGSNVLDGIEVVDGNLTIYINVDEDITDGQVYFSNNLTLETKKVDNVNAATTINGSDFYLYNLGTDKYLDAKGTGYGLSSAGISLDVTTVNDDAFKRIMQYIGRIFSGGRTVTKVNLTTKVGQNGNDYMNQNGVSGNSQVLYFYWIDTNNKKIGLFNEYSNLCFNTPFYVDNVGNVNVNKSYISATRNTFNDGDLNAVWQLRTKEDRKEQLARATTDAPEDATFLIKDPNFGYLDQRYAGWTGTSDGTKAGTQTNQNFGVSGKTFNIYQTLTDMPEGLYELTAQGVCTSASNGAYLYATGDGNTSTYTFENDSVADANAASTAFSSGNYKRSILVYVGADGNLTIGARSGKADGKVFVDNFVLIYYGPTNIILSGYLKNPSFNEGDTRYWTQVGGSIKGDDNHFEAPANATISQEVTDLPNGIYSVKMNVIEGNPTLKVVIKKTTGEVVQTLTETGFDGASVPTTKTLSRVPMLPENGDVYVMEIVVEGSNYKIDNFVLSYTANTSNNPTNPGAQPDDPSVDPSTKTDIKGKVSYSTETGNVVFTGNWKGSEGLRSINNSIAIYKDAHSFDFSGAELLSEMQVTIPTGTNPNIIVYEKAGGDANLKFASNGMRPNNIVTGAIADRFVVTDGYSLFVGKEFTATEAIYERKMSNALGTICLPFTISSKDGSYEVAKMKSLLDNGNLDYQKIDILAVGTPGIIKRTQADVNVRIECQNVLVKKTLDKVLIESEISEGVYLVGSYEKVTVGTNNVAGTGGANNCYYISKNQFYQGRDWFYNNPFRAYIDARKYANEINQSNSRLRSVLGLEEYQYQDEEVTFVENVDGMDVVPVAYFTANGVKVSEPQAGLNIIKYSDGTTRKVFVK